MNKSKIISLQVILLVLGAAGWIGFSNSFREDGKLQYHPNVLHLKGSPFGRTLALAMRGPVDVYWHRGAVHDHEHGPGEGHQHGPDCDLGAAGQCEHDHDHGHGPDHGSEENPHKALSGLLADMVEDQSGRDTHQAERTVKKEFEGVRSFLLDRIEAMRKTYYTRINSRADSRLHKAYILGETQKRLELSYRMDPTNLSGYGAYFLFLSEALARLEGDRDEHGIIRIRQQAALDLSSYTLRYCLNHQDEVTAMITAASAAHDYLQIYLTLPNPDLEIAGEYLRLLDGSLQRYEALRSQMIQNGLWERFSIYRRAELDNTHKLVRVLREADHKMFGELTSNPAGPAEPPRS